MKGGKDGLKTLTECCLLKGKTRLDTTRDVYISPGAPCKIRVSRKPGDLQGTSQKLLSRFCACVPGSRPPVWTAMCSGA